MANSFVEEALKILEIMDSRSKAMISTEDNRIDAAGVLLHEKQHRLNKSSEDGIDAVVLNADEFKQIKDAFFCLASRVKAISAKQSIDNAKVRRAKIELSTMMSILPDIEFKNRVRMIGEGMDELERIAGRGQGDAPTHPDAIAALKMIESGTAMMIRDWDGIKGSPGLIYRINDLKNAAKKGLLALSEPIASPMDDETPTKIEGSTPCDERKHRYGEVWYDEFQAPNDKIVREVNVMAQGEPYNPQDSPPDRHGDIPRESSEPRVIGPQEYMTPESIRKAMDEDEDEPNAFAEGCVKNIIDKMDSAVMITFREGRIFTAIGNGFMASLPPGAQVSIRTHDVEVHYDPPAGEF